MLEEKSILFGLSEDYVESYQSLDERLIKNKNATFFFRASSPSMAPLIFPGDLLIVDRSLSPYSSCLIIAAHNGELLCRRYILHQGKIILRTEKQSPDLLIQEESETLVWGVVINIIRDCYGK